MKFQLLSDHAKVRVHPTEYLTASMGDMLSDHAKVRVHPTRLIVVVHFTKLS